MSNLALVKSENFGNVQCDFYSDHDKEIWMTREQIGRALEYSEPRIAIYKLHERNKDRLDRFSVVTNLTTTDGKSYETYLYSAKGVYEICRFSRQPKADAFMDFVWDVLESLRKGETVLVQPVTEDAKLQIQKQRAEAMLLNARTRQAKLILEMQKTGNLSPIAVELLGVNAVEVLTDQPVNYRPEVEKTYTATEIGEELGVSANKIGRIANANNLKTPEYGITVLDKSRYSNKQVSSFRYNEAGKQKLLELFSG
jgi:prophage antirepressor-like protein